MKNHLIASHSLYRNEKTKVRSGAKSNNPSFQGLLERIVRKLSEERRKEL